MRAVPAIILSNKPSNGIYTVYLRISHGQSRAYYDTGFGVKKTWWNDKAKSPDRKVKDACPDADDYNKQLRHLVERTKDNWEKALHDGTVPEPSDLKRMLELAVRFGGNGVPDDVEDAFWPVADIYISGLQKPGTRDSIRACLSQLRNYAPNLRFSEINAIFLAKYQNHLFNKCKLGQNTVIKKMSVMRTVCNKAVDYGVIPASPWRHKLPKIINKSSTYLTVEELKRLNNVVLPDGIQDMARDIFMFGYYAHGIRVSDRIMLRWSDWSGDYITLNAQKNKAAKVIAVHQHLAAILLKYEGKHKKWIFPLGQDDSDLKAIDITISRSTSRINKALKDVAAKCGIDKPIATHMARHTLANQLLINGTSIEMIANVLGNDIEATKSYIGRFPQAAVDKAVMDIYEK